jgi:hypothetical protein
MTRPTMMKTSGTPYTRICTQIGSWSTSQIRAASADL